jgi:hypothetical protein
LAIKYLTGYQDPLRYNTFRGELGLQLFTLPLVVWAQTGYMSSLANYYKKVSSFGIEVRFESF